MDVVQIVDQPRRVIQVLRRGFAVFQRDRVDDMHRRPGGAVMDVGAGQQQVVLRVAGVEGDVAGGDGQHVLDQRARKADAAVVALDRPSVGQDLHARGRGLAEPDLFQRVQRGGVDLLHPGIGQGLVLAAGHARAHRAHVIGQGGRAHCHAGLTPTGPPRAGGFANLSDFGDIIHRCSAFLLVQILNLPPVSGGTCFVQARIRSDFGSYIGTRLAIAAWRLPATSIS
jgi:hypothetical protein